MLVNQISKTTGLTKKAIEYYTIQGLVSPSILDNGYRNYSENDIETLNKISVLRKLDMSIEEIRSILSDSTNTALQVISVRKELDFQRKTARKALINKLSSGNFYSEVSLELKMIENSRTIIDKISEAFPGNYGRFICLHFAQFLNEPIRTETQQTAYEKIISFLDSTPSFDLPEELNEYLIEGTKHIGTEQIKDMIESIKKYIENPSDFLFTHKETLEQYLTYKQSDEYKNSIDCKIMEIIKEFHNLNGYYDVFIPALKKLSSSYSEYYRHLEIANKKLLTQYPDISKISN